jgi:hypothetical protein
MFSLTLLLALSVSATPAEPLLKEARRLADDLAYPEALKVIDQGLALPGLEPEELVGFYELAGLSRSALNQAVRARESFSCLLSLDPGHQLPKGSPPRTRTAFFEARDWVARMGAVTLEPEPAVRADGQVTQLGVRLSDNPLLVARSVRFSWSADGGAELSVLVQADGRHRVTTPSSGRSVRWRAELLNDRQSVLARLPWRDEAPAVEAPKAPEPVTVVAAPVESARPTWLRPAGFVVGGLGVVALGLGAGFGVASSTARARVVGAARDAQGVVTGVTQREAAALDAQARANALLANVLFVSGGLLAAAGGTLVLVGSSAPDGPTVSLGVGPAAVALSGQF